MPSSGITHRHAVALQSALEFADDDELPAAGSHDRTSGAMYSAQKSHETPSTAHPRLLRSFAAQMGHTGSRDRTRDGRGGSQHKAGVTHDTPCALPQRLRRPITRSLGGGSDHAQTPSPVFCECAWSDPPPTHGPGPPAGAAQM